MDAIYKGSGMVKMYGIESHEGQYEGVANVRLEQAHTTKTKLVDVWH